jgi:predicted permease
MLYILEDILTYISGFYTLPWILIGFIVTILIARVTGREKIDNIMKKIGLILLYFFIPLLIFRVFLDLFEESQIIFVIIVFAVIFLMYILAYFYGKYAIKKQDLKGEKKSLFLKTILTNQGRSSAFIGMMMMEYWPVAAGIMIALVGIVLFAIIPYILSHMHKKELKSKENKTIKALPWYLRLYPWYLISFVIVAIVINITTGVTIRGSGDLGVIIIFISALTIPAALYYVGACIHPSDLKKSELKKLIGFDKKLKKSEHWPWVRKIFILTVIITPIVITIIFLPLLILNLVPQDWFAVIIINSFLPITSTNMFLLPYGIDKKSTAHSITWTTIVCVPIVVLLIIVFGLYLI